MIGPERKGAEIGPEQKNKVVTQTSDPPFRRCAKIIRPPLAALVLVVPSRLAASTAMATTAALSANVKRLLAETAADAVSLTQAAGIWHYVEAHVTYLYKGAGKKSEISNYRPISLTSIIAKVFTKILQPRPEKVIHPGLSPFQGCGKGGSRGPWSISGPLCPL